MVFFVLRGRFLAFCLCAALCLAITAIIFSGRRADVPAMATEPLPGAGGTVVVIDAGHGGADGGAVAEDGTSEAEINLAVAKRLEAVFALLGQKTAMIRREDVSIHSDGVEGLRNQKVSDIHNRVDLVNGTENAVLISIHQNSLPQARSVHGAQSFYNVVKPAGELAAAIQTALNASVNSGNEKQEKRIDTSVYLMEHIDAPGVLVECGFLSNAQETQLLKTEGYQTKLALTIAAGYLEYDTAKDSEAEKP